VHYAHLAEVYGLQYVEDGDFTVLEEARAISQKAEALSPNALETYRARGYILYLYGQYHEAVLQYEKAINLNPNIADLYLALGRVYRTNELAEYNLATDAFRQADILNPADPLPDFLLSRVYFTQGEFTSAIQYAENAVRDEPSNPDWHGNLGTLLYRNGEYGKAIMELGLVIKGGQTDEGVVVVPLPLSYDTAAYFYTYGLTLAKVGECGEALQISQALIQNVANDEFAVFNAQEIINICQQVADGEVILTPDETDGDSTNEDSATP
jgi:tetratricopeptide (TPR) repeat protein